MTLFNKKQQNNLNEKLVDSSLSGVNKKGVSFEEKEIKQLLDMLDQEYLNLTKYDNNLKKLVEDIKTQNVTQYEKTKKTIFNRMDEAKKALFNLNSIKEKIIRLLNKNDNFEFNKSTEEKIRNSNKKIVLIIDQIASYEEAVRLKDRNSSVNNPEDSNSRLTVETNQTMGMNQSFMTNEIDALRMSLLVVTEIQSQEQFLKQREEKLLDMNM